MEAPQQDQHREGDGGDEPVVVGGGFQIDAEQCRPRDAAEAVLAAGDVGPAERYRIQHRRQRQRQQREIHAAPAQDQESEGEGDGHHDQDAADGGTEKRIRHQIALDQRRRIGGEAEPGAMAERDQAGMPDQDVQRHAGQREGDDLGGRGHGEAEREQHRRQHEQPEGGDQQAEWAGGSSCQRLTRTA